MAERVGYLVNFLKSWGTLILALVALIQPWLVALYRRFFRQAQLDIYETGDVEIGFSHFGPTIGLHGTLRTVNRDSFVRSINLRLTRYKDRAEHQFSWGVFRSDKLSLASGQDTTFQLCSGFMLTLNSPFPYNIQFWDRDVQEEIRPHLQSLRSAWAQAFLNAGGSQLLEAGVDLAAVSTELQAATRSLYSTFSTRTEHVEAFSSLGRLCYWEPGRYRVRMNVDTARPDRTHSQTWDFDLSQADVEALRLNIIKILQECCGQVFGVYNFAYPKYQPATLVT